MISLIENNFSAGLLRELHNLSGSFDIPDNNLRADAMMDVLLEENFIELGCGTNRLVVTKEDLDIVFKIALDDRGVIDNNVENTIYNDPDLKEFVTKSLENTGLISVAEKIEVMDYDMMEDYYEDVKELLSTIAMTYVLNDVGFKQFRNWGVDEDGKPKLLDYAYLSKVEDAEMQRCKKDGGKLIYTEDLSGMRCKKCGAFYSISQVVGSITDPLIEMGFTTYENAESTTHDSDVNDIGFYDK